MTFEGLISIENLSRIWEKSCRSQPDLLQLYDYAEEVAFEFFEERGEEDVYQDSDVSDEDSSMEEIVWTEEPGEWELVGSSRLPPPAHVTNGVPSELVPEDVMWDGERWCCWNTERTRPYSSRQLERFENRKKHIRLYPCETASIVGTYEFDEILEIAGYLPLNGQMELDTRMAVLGWIHEINIEISSEWGD